MPASTAIFTKVPTSPASIRNPDRYSRYTIRGAILGSFIAVEEFRLVGLTPTGRATVRVLAMNDTDRVQLRQIAGIHDPPS
jgi:hypothetical protein